MPFTKAESPVQASKDAARAQPIAQLNIANKTANFSYQYQWNMAFF
jgi:hypothetical protein